MTEAILFVAVLLLIGMILRAIIPVFQSLYIPASVIAGACGLCLIQSGTIDSVELAKTLRSWPAWLIAVVFAGMLLERKPASFSESASRVGRQGLMVWVIVLGQTAIGLLATAFLVQPYYDVPNAFGMLIETGFAGGHGTAAAMGQVFAHPRINLASGLDLGVLMATCGLVYGVVSGIVWVNLGVRMGWVGNAPGEVSKTSVTPKLDQENAVPIGYARVSSAVMDPLLLQIVWLSLALGIGIAMHHGVAWIAGELSPVEASTAELDAEISKPTGEAKLEADVQSRTEGAVSGTDEPKDAKQSAASGGEKELSDRMTLQTIVDSFPLFIYTLFGGLILRQLLGMFGHDALIDRETINRLTATAMDVLVVAAIASLNITAVVTLLVPFAILFVSGVIWAGVCLLFFARRLLPRKHWFELGLINYGMSTGTTATGFVLLRLVDPELESGAAEDYALAAPLSSPFIGGGIITIGLPLLVLQDVPIFISALTLTGLVAILLVLGHRWNRSTQ